jgi:flavin reductase (DIM6/NTAB) family NADH-FMN oxidoreductase RutF
MAVAARAAEIPGREGAGGSLPAIATIDSAKFRRTMGNWATGVTVVTSVGPGGPHGMTANAFLSVSLDPPLVLVSIGRENDSHAILDASRRFAVNVLRADQEALAVLFASRPDPGRAFAQVSYRSSPFGLPWLDGALAWLECELQDAIPAQDHTLFLGRVTALEEGGGDPALLYFRSRYRSTD